jgi:hypothetical protein
VFNYSAYNLGISSALPLPELETSAEVEADVTIRTGKVFAPVPKSDSDEGCFFFSPDVAYLHWSKLGTFMVREGTEIVVDANPVVDSRLLRLPLLGIVLGILLHQRGHLVLHASAVSINGQGVVFVGNQGQGKSTMVAAMYRRGHKVMADDVVALETDGRGQISVLPAFPQVKLFREAVNPAFGDSPEDLPELAEGVEKCWRSVSDGFSRAAVPLKWICILATGPDIALERLSANDALVEMIRHTYVARFGQQLLRGSDASAHLKQCTKVLHNVPVYRLKRPPMLELLPRVAEVVEQGVETSKPAAQAYMQTA